MWHLHPAAAGESAAPGWLGTLWQYNALVGKLGMYPQLEQADLTLGGNKVVYKVLTRSTVAVAPSCLLLSNKTWVWSRTSRSGICLSFVKSSIQGFFLNLLSQTYFHLPLDSGMPIK